MGRTVVDIQPRRQKKSREDKNAFWGGGANGVFAPYRQQWVLTKTAKMTNRNGHSFHKNKGLAPKIPEDAENDEMAGVTHAKTLFAKNPVFATPKF